MGYGWGLGVIVSDLLGIAAGHWWCVLFFRAYSRFGASLVGEGTLLLPLARRFDGTSKGDTDSATHRYFWTEVWKRERASGGRNWLETPRFLFVLLSSSPFPSQHSSCLPIFRTDTIAPTVSNSSTPLRGWKNSKRRIGRGKRSFGRWRLIGWQRRDRGRDEVALALPRRVACRVSASNACAESTMRWKKDGEDKEETTSRLARRLSILPTTVPSSCPTTLSVPLRNRCTFQEQLSQSENDPDLFFIAFRLRRWDSN